MSASQGEGLVREASADAYQGFEAYLEKLYIEGDIVLYPEKTLDILFSKIALPTSRHSERYGKFTEEGGPDLKSMIQQCLRPDIFDLCCNSNRKRCFER
jgi:hypothetical protein